MTSDEECIHGMDSSWCSLCRHPKSETHMIEMRTIKAKFNGQCPTCNLPIYEGQFITGGPPWIHSACDKKGFTLHESY